MLLPAPDAMRTIVDVTSDGEEDIAEVVDVIPDSDDDGHDGSATQARAVDAPPARFHGYRRGRELGRGASGRVFLCSRKGATGGFAVKAVDLRRMQLSSNVEFEHKALKREVDILKRLPPHPNIVQLVDAFEEGDWFLLVLELVGGGDLFTALTSREPQRLREGEAAFVLSQLSDGLAFLHSQGVIHRDLKLENVLVAAESRRRELHLYSVKITDFGLSKSVGAGFSEAYSVVGTHPYTAPEVLSGGSYDFSSDLWCLGVLMYVLLVGHYPFDNVCVDQAEIDRFLGKVHCSDVAMSVLSGLLLVDAKQRLTLVGIRGHEWLLERTDDGELERQAKRRCLPKSVTILEQTTPKIEVQKGVELMADSPAPALALEKDLAQPPQPSGVGEWLAYIYNFSRSPPPSAAPPLPLPPAPADLEEVCPTALQPDIMVVHVAIPENLAGLVLGKPILQMKQISMAVGCVVRAVMRESMGTRLLILIGTFLQCAIVQELVYGRLREALSSQNEVIAEPAEVVLLVRAEAAGVITGKQGFVLKQIRKQSGARIQLLREQVKGHRPCILSGALQSVLQAQRHVFDLVRAVPVAAPTAAEAPERQIEATSPA